MASESASETVIYQIDDGDRICFANDAYDAFAIQNNGSAFAFEIVKGRSLWEFITDETTRAIYEALIQQARGGRAMFAQIRCDSPDCIRELEIMIKGMPGSKRVIFCVDTIACQQRSPVAALQPELQRSEDFVHMCSWCKKVELSIGTWVEVEEALMHIPTLMHAHPPMVTHGICGSCKVGWKNRLLALRSNQ